jgi:hypothetical protein
MFHPLSEQFGSTTQGREVAQNLDKLSPNFSRMKKCHYESTPTLQQSIHIGI